MKDTTVSFRISKGWLRKLKAAATKEEKTVGEYIRLVLEEKLRV